MTIRKHKPGDLNLSYFLSAFVFLFFLSVGIAQNSGTKPKIISGAGIDACTTGGGVLLFL
jgi:hypothetical protein